MRSYSGPPGGYVQPQPQVPVAPAPVAPVAAAPAAAPVSPPPAPVGVAAVCPHCGAGMPTTDVQYCPQCGDPVDATSLTARVRRHLSNRYLVGALAVVFILLLAGVLLAGQGTTVGSGSTAQAAQVAPLPSPTVTAVTVQNRSPLVNTSGLLGGSSGGANTSGNWTPRPKETVLVVKTLDRYIQNAGGDPGSQLRTPMQTQSIGTPAPGITTGPTGDLTWSGEGSYVTDPFRLEAGTARVDLTAEVLTMAQLRDQAGTAIGIATAGPQPGGATIGVPVSGAYRLEIWPFGPGPWTVAITYPSAPPAIPTLAPVTVNTTAPIPVVPSENLTTAAETSVPPTQTPTETPTAPPTQASAPMPTQAPRTFTGNGNATTPVFTLNQGLATFTSSTTANGTFSVTLVGSGETPLVAPAAGPLSSSKPVQIPATGSYLLNVMAGGAWEVSIA